MAEVDEGAYSMLGAVHGERVMLLRPLQPVGGQGWYSGRRFKGMVPQPVDVEVVDGYENRTVPLAYSAGVPLMRDDLLTCLCESGVDNLDAYPAVIRDKAGTIELTGYSAVNIIGLVRVANPRGTLYYPGTPSRLIDADIDSLVIDPTRALGLLMFRLAECVTGVVVHESVRRAVESRREFRDVRFAEPEDWMG